MSEFGLVFHEQKLLTFVVQGTRACHNRLQVEFDFNDKLNQFQVSGFHSWSVSHQYWC